MDFFDLLQETAQGRFVGGVASHDFVSQRKTFGRDDQRDDHLHTVRTLVAAVAKLPLVALRKRRVAFKISRGQIVEQHFKLHAEQILPTPASRNLRD